MISKIFTVFDTKVEAYLTPFYMKSKGEAIRSFTEACNDPQTMFFKHPEDYVLFELGDYSDSDASFCLLPSPRSIGCAIEFKKVVEV